MSYFCFSKGLRYLDVLKTTNWVLEAAREEDILELRSSMRRIHPLCRNMKLCTSNLDPCSGKPH
jgi:hypothetical protein